MVLHQHPTDRSYWLSDSQWPAMPPRSRGHRSFTRTHPRTADIVTWELAADIRAVRSELKPAPHHLLNEASLHGGRKSKGAASAPPHAAWLEGWMRAERSVGCWSSSNAFCRMNRETADHAGCDRSNLPVTSS